MRGVTGFRVLDAVNGALAQLVPERVGAAGEGGNTLAIFGADRPGGDGRFIFYELVVGTWGGTPEGDGNDGLTNPASLAANIPVEVAESEFPIRIEHYGLGPGQRRAPAATAAASPVERAWRCLTPDTSLIVRSDRAAHAPYGLLGGMPGALSSNVLHSNGSETVLPSMFSTIIGEGDLYVHRMAGGGGWGDPRDRDPEAVRDDVLDGKVTPEAAKELYGWTQ
jgi:N-methylhydantoinase B